MRVLKNLVLFLRDLFKQVTRLIEQVLYRVFYVRRVSGTSISPTVRLDIGPKISFKKHPHKGRLFMGQRSRIESYAVINAYHGDVEMGYNSRVGIGTIIIGPVKIGNNSGVSQYCFVTGENRKHSLSEKGLNKAIGGVSVAPVVIGEGVWVGAGVRILPGVTIGDGSVVAAGAVVTKSIPPFSLAAGVPAKVIKNLLEGKEDEAAQS